MSDIVEQLRGDLDLLSSPQLRELGEKAAAEIDKLQRLIGDMLHAQHKQERTNVLQEAEIERLRGTLREIKRCNAQYNFGSKLVRLVDAALEQKP